HLAETPCGESGEERMLERRAPSDRFDPAGGRDFPDRDFVGEVEIAFRSDREGANRPETGLSSDSVGITVGSPGEELDPSAGDPAIDLRNVTPVVVHPGVVASSVGSDRRREEERKPLLRPGGLADAS